jgi:exopolyphosphatase / guanosine-5'-triphosphate,3'-diphosphate pyrophosphatase
MVEEVTFHSVDNVLKNFEMNLDHCHHVKKLALSLFDQLKEIHGWGSGTPAAGGGGTAPRRRHVH